MYQFKLKAEIGGSKMLARVTPETHRAVTLIPLTTTFHIHDMFNQHTPHLRQCCYF
jgi:hypothetical protein